MAQILSLIII